MAAGVGAPGSAPQGRLLFPRALAAAAVTLLALSGCGDSDEGTQPAPQTSTFEQGDFEGFPLPPRSEPVSERTEERGVVARSYAARNTSPEAVLDFYAQQLTSAVVLEPPHDVGVGTLRGRWSVDGRELTVSATREESLDAIQRFGENVDAVAQFSLSLAPVAGEQ